MKQTCFTVVTAVIFTFCLAMGSSAGAESSAALVAGTAPAFVTTGAAIKGQLDVIRQPTLVFTGIDKPLKGQALSVPFDRVTDVEHGGKPGPKASTVALATAAFGVAGFFATNDGVRNEFITIA